MAYIPACKNFFPGSRSPGTVETQMMLMIVNDNAQVRRVIRRICQDFATGFCECADGAEALATYREQRPDWVVMDVSMEVMDGLTATRHILAAFPAARIVIITRLDDAEMREAARRAGAWDFVAKENLMELRDLLGASRQP